MGYTGGGKNKETYISMFLTSLKYSAISVISQKPSWLNFMAMVGLVKEVEDSVFKFCLDEN